MDVLKKLYSFVGLLGGKRFITAFIALLAIALHDKFGLSEEQIVQYAGYAAGFIFADNVISKLSGGATSAETFHDAQK